MENELTKTRAKGLTGFDLKWIALILMVLDHIQYFFEYTGKVPLFFSWLGRMSAPLFLFCMVEGFIHTHNRKRYFLTIYAIAIAMGLFQYGCMYFGICRPDGFYPENQVLSNFAILIVILQGIEWLREKQMVKGLLAVILPVAWPFIVLAIVTVIPAFSSVVGILHYSILPMHTAIKDGGSFFILLGILLYLLRNHRKGQAAVMIVEPLLETFLTCTIFFPEVTGVQYFTLAYEWMSAFAGIFILFYNGEKGRGSKKFFYWFYPGHVYVLFALSWLLYAWLA